MTDLTEAGISPATGDYMLAVAAAQLAQRNLAAPLPEAACPVGDRAYTSNEELWHDLISDSVRAPAVIRLMDFWLSDWFPLRPGLYHTPAARSRRAMARGHLLSGPGVNSEGLQAFERLIQHRLSQKLIGRLRPESTYVYDPYGKCLMLDGCVGCVRFKPKQLPEGEVWFMGASSTPVAHQGIPVALPESLYSEFAEKSVGKGYFRCTLTGRLTYIPSDFDPLYRDLVGIPQVYLRVDAIQASDVDAEVAFLADGAVTVLAPRAHRPPTESWELADGVYAAFVSFDPGKSDSIQDATQWLAEVYAGELLKGRIVTDFDERTRRFTGTVFSLEQVMYGNIPMDVSEEVLHRCAASQRVLLQFNQRIETVNSNVGNIIVDKKVIGDNNVVASEGSAAAGLGGAAATHGSAAAVQGAAAAGQSSANRGFVEQAKKSLRVKLAGLIALLATIAATALLVSGITNLGITGYVVAIISVIVGIVPFLSTQQLVGGEETGRNKMKAGSNPHIP
jgi:hypothetical protein